MRHDFLYRRGDIVTFNYLGEELTGTIVGREVFEKETKRLFRAPIKTSEITYTIATTSKKYVLINIEQSTILSVMLEPFIDDLVNM